MTALRGTIKFYVTQTIEDTADLLQIAELVPNSKKSMTLKMKTLLLEKANTLTENDILFESWHIPADQLPETLPNSSGSKLAGDTDVK